MPAWLLHDYWPWWLGASFFGAFVVSMWLYERRLLGVSGSIAASVELTREEDAAARRLDAADAAAVDDALMRATLAAFGEDEVGKYAGAAGAPAITPRSQMPRSVHITFLVMLAAGGMLGALASGTWELRFDLGPVHEALFGGGLPNIVVLLFGGVLVGLGTRMAGGCTSGHGLSGCSRLVPASLAATASFFGTGVAVSFLLEALQ